MVIDKLLGDDMKLFRQAQYRFSDWFSKKMREVAGENYGLIF